MVSAAADSAAAESAAADSAGADSAPATSRRAALLGRLGLRPTVGEVVRAELEMAIRAAEARASTVGGPSVTVLDAGCGRVSALRPFRARIGRFVGADIHAPARGALPYLDEFAVVDLCTDADAFPPESFDLILSSFTLEHFHDPTAALRAFNRWLRPDGVLVVTTVNRRHPFVAAYLALPRRVRERLQPVVKVSRADAHPLVGACNDPSAVEAALREAGFADVRLQLFGHLARAWRRTLPTHALGLLGDGLARPFPSRRSTILAVARGSGRPRSR